MLPLLRVLSPAPQAEKTFTQMAKAGIAPNAISYSTVIHAHAMSGNAAKAQVWLDKMKQHGISADAISYNSVRALALKSARCAAAAVCAVASCAAARSVFLQLILAACSRCASCSSSRLTLSPLVQVCAAHAKKGDVQAALTCFNAMSRAGVSPSPQTHSIMINALVQSGTARARICQAMVAVTLLLGFVAWTLLP